MNPPSLRQHLADATLDREEVDRFLDAREMNFGRHDGELGWTLRDCVIRDGIDGACSTYRYAAGGERLMISYADRPCRINTYGDSMTQCHQVSDGETWQEALAAHIGEPIRNFGVGGYGVYQAYRRMLRHEATASAAPYVMFNIYIDDHLRSLDRWFWLRLGSGFWNGVRDRASSVGCFNATHCPWSHLRPDPDTGAIVEVANPYPTPESLYALCDRDHVYEDFRGDLVVQLDHAQRTGTVDDGELIARHCRLVGLEPRLSNPDAVRATARRLHRALGYRASRWTLDRLTAFAERHAKRLLILLSYLEWDVMPAIAGEPRADQEFVDDLAAAGLLHVDLLRRHVEDFAALATSPEEYRRRHFNGHYTPHGNRFFAFAIKDAVVDWLEPRPRSYADAGASYAALAGRIV